MLAARGQMLPFEPIDLGPAIGAGADAADHRRRVCDEPFRRASCRAGAARDHLLGVRGVNGRGEIFKSGGRVMKNVTGYDVARGLAGSWGTLAVLTEVTFKVVPRPKNRATVLLFGLAGRHRDRGHVPAMGTPFEVTGAVHLPARWRAGYRAMMAATTARPITALRIENLAKFVAYRCDNCAEASCKPTAKTMLLDHAESSRFWGELRRFRYCGSDTSTPLWRISTAPRNAPSLVSCHQPLYVRRSVLRLVRRIFWLEVPATPTPVPPTFVGSSRSTAAMQRLCAPTRPAFGRNRRFPAARTGVERLTRGIKDGVRSRRHFESGPDVRPPLKLHPFEPSPADIQIETPDADQLHGQQLEDPRLAEADRILRRCVHCGFCTAVCSTYVMLGTNGQPRGRIYLMKDMFERGGPASPEVQHHVDRCLSCLSCMTTCPGGVDYMHLSTMPACTSRRPGPLSFKDRMLRMLTADVIALSDRFRARYGAAPWASCCIASRPRRLKGAGRHAGAGAARPPPRRNTSAPARR